ncbi:BglG family transcription antiterminator LicT [Terribacillus aidingensis]|uniref:BglG family transcription antiterminator LicT n=1 Tax=Terribacillus aidingensis TaxID=586416 RepID=UPI00344DAEBC
MKIERIINNNIITASDVQNNEVVLMGKGIGFKKEIGQDVLPEEIEKRYTLDSSLAGDKFKDLLKDIPLVEMQAVNEIVSYAKLSLGKKLSNSIYLSLTDHLHFAIERMNNGFEFQNALAWEVKHFYHHEYLIGKEALEIIKRKIGIEFPHDEAITIALHIVNAETENSMSNTVGMTKLIKQILSIIQYAFNVEYDENSLAYERLLTHLKFFVQRIQMNRYLLEDNADFFTMIKDNYKKEYDCAQKISDFIYDEVGHQLTTAELSYLTIHINRILHA